MSALYRRWVAAIVAHPARALMLLGLAMVPALYFAALFFINVRAGLQDLLPADSASVRALDQLHTRIGGVASLIVIVHSPDGAANRRFMAELGQRLRARAIPEAKSIQDDVRTERDWLQRRALLLLDDARFERVMGRVETAVEEAKGRASPLYIDLGGDEPEDLDSIAETLESEAAEADRFPRGVMERPDGTLVVMLISLQGSEVDIGPASKLASAVREEVEALRAERGGDVQVALTGEVQNMIEEHDAIVADVALSSAIVTVLVALLIAVYFRSTRAVLVVIGSLLPGVIYTFAVGRLSGTFLNSNSAFLGSIIAGNGINYPLIFLAYYRAREAEEPLVDAIVGAARQSFAGTLGAAATTSAAYFGLSSAHFRGFSDFGWLGGMGMVSTWVACYLVFPVLVASVKPPRLGVTTTAAQGAVARYFARPRRSRAVAAVLVLVTLAVAGVGLRAALRDGLYDMNLLNLRNSDSLANGSASWDGKISEVFGVWLNPVVAMVDDPAHGEPAAAALSAVLLAGDPPMGERVETIERYLPPQPSQVERIERLEDLQRSLSKVPREKIPERVRPYFDRWLAPENLVPVTAAEIPAVLTLGFREKDGRTDRTVLAYPSLAIDFDDGRNLLRFLDRLSQAELPPDAVVAGGFLFMGEIIGLVRTEAPYVIGVVCLLVALTLVPVFFRKLHRVPLVLVTVGVVAMLAQLVMYAAGVRLNMLNFAAIPITIGVGSDYVVNVLGAMDAMKTDARQAVTRLGGAILLCSLTTVVGYVSLLLAHSGALRSFGWAAVLGELMAVTVVLAILPLVLPDRA